MFGTDRKRRDRYRTWALARNWTYAERDDTLARHETWGLSRAYSSHPQAADVLTGTHRGRPVLCFTYRYRQVEQTGNGPERRRTGTGFYVVRLPHPLPALEVKQRWFIDGRLTTIPEGADFARAYEVVPHDATHPAAILTPALCAWMLQRHATGFQIAGDRLFLRIGNRIELDRLDHWLDYLTQIADQLPL